ncbi:two pore domain potassium channel family protein [Limibaculum sp. M0105]|uniref:Two pore domain potassium channel family protein n=1 Tax=Thermohalobaculum xanthum TaxID=2753746 RepID=A0A8J7M8T9_9RHOB|nr:ion channel [Thermohalobaculum xanthum]MBK0400424.1 two pore domain potassium channel family protein [Thermohalobaculum xanthum]
MILHQLMIGFAMIALTVVIHASFMAAIQTAGPFATRVAVRRSPLRKALIIIVVVIWLFVSICTQCWAWAGLFRALVAFDTLEEALYFSTVTFTTLGYGDIVLGPEWRLLSAFASANGTIIIGWTTALVFLTVQHVYIEHHDH